MRKFVFCLLLSPLAASAADWRFINLKDGEKLLFIDAQSMSADPLLNYRYSWVLVVFKDTVKGKKYSKLRVKVDCNTQQYAFMSNTNYRKDDSIINAENYQSGDWLSAPPETMAEGFVNLSCNKDEALKLSSIQNPVVVSDQYWESIKQEEKQPKQKSDNTEK